MNKEKSYDELRLLVKIGKGNQLTFKSLLGHYRNQLFTYLFTITKSTQPAEEIVVDAFLKIRHGRGLVAAIENFKVFLYRVAINKAIDILITDLDFAYKNSRSNCMKNKKSNYS